MKQRSLRLVETENRFAGLEPDELTESEAGSVMDLALRILAARHEKGRVLENPEQTQAYLRLHLAERPNEVFGCVLLDNKHRIIAVDELFQGTIDGASVHPRVVVQRALQQNCAAVLFFHNHPSGVSEPSQADVQITQRLKDALSLVEIRVLDHVVVATEGSVSFAERGLI
jgi:DNA repair protein RadC